MQAYPPAALQVLFDVQAASVRPGVERTLFTGQVEVGGTPTILSLEAQLQKSKHAQRACTHTVICSSKR